MRTTSILLLSTMLGCADVGLSRFDSGVPASAELGVDPDGEVLFGRVSPAIDKSALEEVVLYSAGGSTLAIVDVYLDESSSGAYSMRDDLPLPLRLAPGLEFPVELRFTPYAVGTFSGELVVLFDNGTPEGESVRIPITGEGCEDPDETGSCF